MSFINQLEALLLQRKQELPPNSYSSSLFRDGIDKILQKLGEESTEYIIASKNQAKQEKVSEAADLLFHFLISLVQNNISYQDIINELEKRNKK